MKQYTGVIAYSNRDYKNFLFENPFLENPIFIRIPADLDGREWSVFYKTGVAEANNNFLDIMEHINRCGLIKAVSDTPPPKITF